MAKSYIAHAHTSRLRTPGARSVPSLPPSLPARARAISALAERFAHAQDARAAAELDFAFFTEVAEAAGNLVFLLILNGIRGVYFEHLDELPVAADVARLAPGYAALADAIVAGDAPAARETAFALAEAQRRAVVA